MKLIRFTKEGGELGPFITISKISDGGWTLHVRLCRLFLYFRKRGPNNPAKPRYIFDWMMQPEKKWHEHRRS